MRANKRKFSFDLFSNTIRPTFKSKLFSTINSRKCLQHLTYKKWLNPYKEEIALNLLVYTLIDQKICIIHGLVEEFKNCGLVVLSKDRDLMYVK